MPIFDAIHNDEKVTLQEVNEINPNRPWVPDCSQVSKCLQTIDEILFENIDVGAAALSSLLLNMASNREAQEQLRSEAKIMSHADELASYGSDAFSYVTKTNTFLDICCRESRRLWPALRRYLV